MEPQLYRSPEVGFSPESLSPPTETLPERLHQSEVAPEVAISSPETTANAEHLTVDHVGRTMDATVVQPVQMPIQDQPVATQPVSTDSTLPVEASDNDVMEKEWVDKIKQIITSTKRDPHAQQNEVSRLMADYVLKRFGKKVGGAEE